MGWTPDGKMKRTEKPELMHSWQFALREGRGCSQKPKKGFVETKIQKTSNKNSVWIIFVK